jgi:hypothetical protein
MLAELELTAGRLRFVWTVALGPPKFDPRYADAYQCPSVSGQHPDPAGALVTCASAVPESPPSTATVITKSATRISTALLL